MTSVKTATLPSFDGRALINGKRVASSSGQVFDCISPVDGRVLTQVARCAEADIDTAVQAARAAFDDRRWCGLPPAQRKRIMIRFADLLVQHADELALTETWDMGKPVKYAKAVDVNSAANCLRWYGEAVDKVYDEIAPTADTALALITRVPVGVVGVIVPWNYPMIMASWKIAPALAAGNSVVLEAQRKVATHRFAHGRSGLGGWHSAPASSTSLPALGPRRARPWPCTWMWIASPSPAPPAWASKSM